MKFLNIFSGDTLKKNVQEVVSRFPVAVLLIALTALGFFLELHYQKELGDTMNENIMIGILSLILTFIMSIGVYLTSENNDFSKVKRNVFQLIPAVFGIGFFFTFTSDVNNFENIVFFLLTLAGIISYLFFAPYLKNLFLPFSKEVPGKGDGLFKIKQSVFYTYFYNIAVVFLITSILGGVMFSLGAIGIVAVDALFDLHIDESLTYGNWAIISLSIIAPFFALTQIPKKSECRESHFNENLFFSFLIKFVAIPFIVIYFLILYAYTIKVLANFGDWPKGEVTWMVIGFSIFGYITYIFSYIFEKKNEFIKKFRSVFPYVVIPQIFMLFYAIYLRINQYDITINRYFVVVFGLWLLVISLYYIISKKKQLLFIPAILTLFTIIISIGPWGVYSLPESRQLARLENNLAKANILQSTPTVPFESYIVPLKNYGDITQELSKDIYSGINYLCDFDNCNSIKKLFPKIYSQVETDDKIEWEKNKKEDIERMELETSFSEYYTEEDNIKRIKERKGEIYEGPNKWTIVSKITEKIKVKYYFSAEGDIPRGLYFGLKSDNENLYPVEVKNYDVFTTVYDINSWEAKNSKLNYMYVVIDTNKKILYLKDGDKEIESIILLDVYDKLIALNKEKSQEQEYSGIYTKEDLSFQITGEKYDYKLFFQNISIPNPAYIEQEKTENNEEGIKDFQVNYISFSTNGFVLIKER